MDTRKMKSRYIKPDFRRYSISVNAHLLAGSLTPGVRQGNIPGNAYNSGDDSYSKGSSGMWSFMSSDADSEE